MSRKIAVDSAHVYEHSLLFERLASVSEHRQATEKSRGRHCIHPEAQTRRSIPRATLVANGAVGGVFQVTGEIPEAIQGLVRRDRRLYDFDFTADANHVVNVKLSSK
jgi:hypothetical protein